VASHQVNKPKREADSKEGEKASLFFTSPYKEPLTEKGFSPPQAAGF
jgi:hypothetical protein